MGPQRKHFYPNQNNLRFQKKLQPISHFLMSKGDSNDFVSIDQLKIDSKKMGKDRDVRLFIGTREEKE